MSGAKLWKRILNGFAAGTISAVDDTGPVMLVQVQIGAFEHNDNVPAPQQFGFASVPPAQSDVAVLFVGGDRSNPAAVATNHQATRFKGKASGESVVFNAFGMSIYLSATGIVIQSAGLPVTINGELRVTGAITEGYGTAPVGVGTHKHGTGAAASGTSAPTPGT